MVVLDTDHISLLERGNSRDAERLRSRPSAVPPDEAATTIITYEEQTRGWFAYMARSRTLTQQTQAYQRLLRHLDHYRHIPVLPFDAPAAAHFQRLQQSRVRIGSMDLKIAAIVLDHDATLLSRKLTDFGLVPGLRIQYGTR